MKPRTLLTAAAAALFLSACGTFGGAKPPISDNERHESAALALLCADVMDTFQANRSNPTPPILNKPNYDLAQDWVVDGYIVGEDRTLSQALRNEVSNTDLVMYGVLAHSKANSNNYVVAIRGTGTPQEWKQDAWFFSLPDKWNDTHGKVEAGFFSIYKTFKYYPAAGSADAVEAWAGIKNVIGNNSLTVTGHSLGSPLATYLSFDLIERGGVKNLRGRYFASPRPGNSDFASAFDKAIQDSNSNYIVYNYKEDAVPHTPLSILGFFYQQLNNVTTLDKSNAQVPIRITDKDIGCSHHVVSYAAMLDFHMLPDMEAWKQRYRDNHDSDQCI
jgi:triacylglycerol lipase